MLNELMAAAFLGVRPSPLAVAIIGGKRDNDLDQIINEMERLGRLSDGEIYTLDMAYRRLDLITTPKAA